MSDQFVSVDKLTAAADPITSCTRIGHVHLRVSDLERSLQFYCSVPGFELMQYPGARAALISAGAYHHHIALNTGESLGGAPPPRGTTGLDHFANIRPALCLLIRSVD